MHRRAATLALASYLLAAFVLPAVHHLQHLQHAGTPATCCHEHVHGRPLENRSSSAEGYHEASHAGESTVQLERPPAGGISDHACAICQAFQAKQLAAVVILAVLRGELHTASPVLERSTLAHCIIGSASPRGPPLILA